MSTVTPELRDAVFKRDGNECVAPRLGGTSLDCWGRNRIEHVHGKNEMGVGKPRAESDMAHLVTLCQGHTEDGMRAGYVWATDRENRDAMRRYLRGFE